MADIQVKYEGDVTVEAGFGGDTNPLSLDEHEFEAVLRYGVEKGPRPKQDNPETDESMFLSVTVDGDVEVMVDGEILDRDRLMDLFGDSVVWCMIVGMEETGRELLAEQEREKEDV